jgi:hypothetical protein
MDSDYLFSAIGNFQLKNAYVPHKAAIGIKTFGAGNKNWSLTAPGVVSTTSGNGDNPNVTASNLSPSREYRYSLAVNGVETYSVTQPLVPEKNIDKSTPLGDVYLTEIATGQIVSSVKIGVSVPSFRSFFLSDKEAIKQQTQTFSWSLQVTGEDEPTTGTIAAFSEQVVENRKTVTKYNVNKTVVTINKQGQSPFKVTHTDAIKDINLGLFNATNDTPTDITFFVGTKIAKTISVTTVDQGCGYIGKLSGSLEVDAKTIVVEDTSSIKVGQEIILNTKGQRLSASGTSVVEFNVFKSDNENALRVESVEDDTRFKVRQRYAANKGLFNSSVIYEIETINFNDKRALTLDSTDKAGTKTNPAGNKDSSTLAKGSTITGVIKNYLSSETKVSDKDSVASQTVPQGSVQASALVMSGPPFNDSNDPNSIDFISYTYKNLGADAARYKYFGTRLRIIGKYEYGQEQSGVGEDTWYTSKQVSPSGNISKPTVKASSGGIAVLLNPVTNNGYYFEIAALSDTSVARTVKKYSQDGKEVDDPIHNLLFYKMNAGVDEEGLAMENQKATPVKLWGGFTNVLTDNGSFVGQGRMTSAGSANNVYDLAVEYEIVESYKLKFYLYVNGILVGTVVDEEPFLYASGSGSSGAIVYNNMALFVRGKAKLMFEHVYAVADSPTKSASEDIAKIESSVFGDIDGSITFNESMKKYAISGVVTEAYLKGVSPSEPPKGKLYYEEFGTIMREAAYFNVRYDKSYPAMLSLIAPTYTSDRGFTVSGFMPGPYSAEFMIFNATDTALALDGTGGNYLRIHGVTFTQQSTHELTVDEYFSTRSSLSNPQTPDGSSLIRSPQKEVQEYNRIRNSRSAYGKKEFTLDSRYIQSQDAANKLMEWITSKIMKPRKSVGVKVFSMPTLQLGDIVNIDMKDQSGIDQVAPATSRFVVYQIEYAKSSSGTDMNVFLSEVV